MRPQGYLTSSGYKGFIRGRWMLFPTEQEYTNCFYEWLEEVDT